MANLSNFGWIKSIDAQAQAVVDCLGGGEKAKRLLLETASAETALGKIYDRTVYAGMGICQFDKAPFYRIKKASQKYRDKILRELGVDIKLVEWEHLRYDAFVSLIFCRLYYLLIPKPIPKTLEGRAKYWKKYYNTYLGKGTPEHYIKMTKRYLDAAVA